jgi:hypothetical protein
MQSKGFGTGNRARLKLLLDDKLVGSVGQGEQCVFDVTRGSHRLRGKARKFGPFSTGSPFATAFVVRDEEEIHFKISHRTGGAPSIRRSARSKRHKM